MERAGRGPTRRERRGSVSSVCAIARIRAAQTLALLALATAALLLLVPAPHARADFPYVGDGNAGEPSSWALKPGHTPTNVGGLTWKFAATPATPPSEGSDPAGHQAV